MRWQNFDELSNAQNEANLMQQTFEMLILIAISNTVDSVLCLSLLKKNLMLSNSEIHA